MSENLFKGLEKLGLGMFKSMDIYDKEEEKSEKAVERETVEVKITEKDFLLDKTYECPVCGNKFKTKIVKANRAKLVGTDMDLRPRYQGIDIVKYDCVACEKCGYSALTRFFNYMTDTQAKLVKTCITPSFKGLEKTGDTYTYEEAFIRYQLALANAVVTKTRVSEKAYICLKCAWILRGMAESLPEDAPDRDKVYAKYKEEEKSYVVKAYEGFSNAISKENFPICGMDNATITYLLAALAVHVGDASNAVRYINDVITARGIAERTKDKARELREILKRNQQQ